MQQTPVFKAQALSDTKIHDGEAHLPKSGRVNEMCQEWMIREDGALAYRLQNEEIKDHYTGNKVRNQLVREDFPCAKSEQLREQQLAEQAAAVYHRMLQEQEELDNQVAKQLAEKLEIEEKLKRQALVIQDQDVARELLEKELIKVDKYHQSPNKPFNSPQKLINYPSPNRPNSINYQANLPKRSAKPMPLPDADLYTEPYLVKEMDQIEITDDIAILDKLSERQIQEEKDAELARQLQEQEGSLEETLLNRDRLLAIEAQDKELAKLLQERERNKARRARERAKQKALAKKQQMEQVEKINNNHQIMPDDSYSYPADLIPPRNSISQIQNNDTYAIPESNNVDDINYSLPADILSSRNSNENNLKVNYTNKIINTKESIRPFDSERENTPIRPNQLDLRSPLNKINKPRYPDPPLENYDISPSSQQSQHINIAMAIDPTYPRRGVTNPVHSPSSFDSNSSTITTSTSSSSPGIVLPPSDINELDNEGIVPPYMPIQGQRRTASLEKKQKKKNKDSGCKQQ